MTRSQVFVNSAPVATYVKLKSKTRRCYTHWRVKNETMLREIRPRFPDNTAVAVTTMYDIRMQKNNPRHPRPVRPTIDCEDVFGSLEPLPRQSCTGNESRDILAGLPGK